MPSDRDRCMPRESAREGTPPATPTPVRCDVEDGDMAATAVAEEPVRNGDSGDFHWTSAAAAMLCGVLLYENLGCRV